MSESSSRATTAKSNNNNINNELLLSSNNNLPPVVRRIALKQKMPICVIIVGMAGSGKSSLMTQLQTNLEEKLMTNRDDDNNNNVIQSTNTKMDIDSISTTTTKGTTTTKSDNDNNENPSDLSTMKDMSLNDDKSNDNNAKVVVKEETVKDDDDDNDDDIDIDDNDEQTWYCMNLDPATLNVAYDVSIDIRDTINYKQVMKQHKLGPNGAIMTSLNLFATKFDQVMNILEKRSYGENNHNNIEPHTNNTSTTIPSIPSTPSSKSASNIEYILVDTPGQIEAFTWSASGSIICESLASAFPTVLCYVIDTVRCTSSPNTFMSNMLYACSMMYRTKLPIIICFNKIDIISHTFCIEWMKDYEIFQQALDDMNESSGFYSSLTRSLSLVLDEFYSNFVHTVGVSAMTGDGISEFWNVIQTAANTDFRTDYIEDLKDRITEQQIKQKYIAKSQINKLHNDLQQDNNNDD